MSRDVWSADRLQTLEEHWRKGYSASAIAALLGAGITRNAVIGKVHRLRHQQGADIPPNQRERIVHLAKVGKTIAEISEQLDISKSNVRVVISQSRRLGVEIPKDRRRGANSGLSHKLKVHGRRALAPKKTKPPAPQPEPPPLPPNCEPVSYMALRPFHCRWIIGQACGPDTLSCGAKASTRTVGGKIVEISWCAYHARLAYEPPPERQRRQAQAA